MTAQIGLEFGGVLVRTESVDMAEWSLELATRLAVLAHTNPATARLLRRLTSCDDR